MPSLFRSIKIKRLHPYAVVPSYATAGSAGMDLHVVFDDPSVAGHMLRPVRFAKRDKGEKPVIRPGEIVVFKTGIAMQIPRGYEGQVRSRSGLSSKYGVQVVNAPGTIDSDYRGEVKVPLVNLGRDPVWIEPGQRVAQLVIAPVTQLRFVEADELDTTERGKGGFGSTGK